MDATTLIRSIHNFLAEAESALVLDGDEVLFDLAQAKYSIADAQGKCTIHLWSSERNLVRRVVKTELKKDALVLHVLRFGQSKPTKLEIVRERDRRTPTAKRAGRSQYQTILRKVLEREFPDLKLDKLTSTADLEKTFSPVYTRGLLKRGRSGWAVLGVNASESQTSVDAALAFALLWLEHLRAAGDMVIEGLKLFAPAGKSPTLRERLAHLNHRAAKFEIYELNERTGELTQLDSADRGNIATRLVRAHDVRSAQERFAASIERIRRLAPDAEIRLLSPTEISFRHLGLEFARARVALEKNSFRNNEEVVFGWGAYEKPLMPESDAEFSALVRALLERRKPRARKDDPLWRMAPERWLESLIVQNVARLDAQLHPQHVYSQVPAFAASDRGVIDVLTVTREGRLAVIEIKADEDLHLPLQGLDYYARVAWHHARGEFQQFGYFPGVQLSPQSPLLMLVAPALRVHPATDTLLKYLSPDIDCELIGVHENWREELRVIFRKRKENALTAYQRR